jgi:glutathione S-transferase
LLPDHRLLLRIMSRGVPRFEAVSLPVIMPGVVRLIRAALRITPESATRSIERVRALFKEVDGRLGDGRRFLVDGRFTAADLAFAALAAPVLFPAEYRAAYPSLDDVPAEMRDEVLRLRDTAAGRFAMRLYVEERDRVCAVS